MNAQQIKVRMTEDHVDGLMINQAGFVTAVGRHGTVAFPTMVEFTDWLDGKLRIRSSNFVAFDPRKEN